MTALTTILNSPTAYRLGLALLHSLWQGAAVLLALFAIRPALRKATSTTRYAAFSTAMMLLLAGPVLTFSWVAAPDRPAVTASSAITTTSPASPHVPDDVIAAAQPIVIAPTRPRAVAPPRPRVAAATADVSHPVLKVSLRERVVAGIPWIVSIWLAGVVVLALRNIGGWILLQRLRSFTSQSAGGEVDRCVRTLSERLGIRRSVCVFTSALAKAPMVIGFCKPVILIPVSALSALSIPELESILAHELAHIRRHDYAVNLLQAVAETLLFYHPAVWIVSRQLRAERENCCDDLALSVTRDRRIYATALAAVASVRVTSLVPAASGGKLLPRLHRVLQIPDRDSGRSSRWIVGVVVTMLVAVAAIAPHLQTISKAAAATTQPAGDDIIPLRGRVVDPAGKPIAGAKITVCYLKMVKDELEPAVISRVISGADGRFQTSFSKSAASPFSTGFGISGNDNWKNVQVVAHAEGLGLDWQRFDHVDAAGDIQLQLVQDFPVHGRLVDLEGNPAAGVKVSVIDMWNYPMDSAAAFEKHPEDLRVIVGPRQATEQAAAIISDADGKFTISGLGRERRATLAFYSEQFATNKKIIITREGDPVHVTLGSSKVDGNMTYYASPFTLSVSPARTVTGTVTDAQTHRPIAGASVSTSYSRVHGQTVTGADGKFQLQGLERREKVEITVRTLDEPYLPALVDVPDAAGFAPVVSNVEMTRGVWISGKVADQQNGQPVPAMVDYLPLMGNKLAEKIPLFRVGYAQPPCNSEVQPDGSYRVVAMPGPGVIAVRTQLANYALGQGFDKLTSRGPRGEAKTLLPDAVQQRLYTAVREIDAAVGVVTGDVNFALDGGAAIHVTCVDPDGKPAKNVRVMGHSAVLVSHTTAVMPDGQFDAVGMGKDEKRVILLTDEKRHWAQLTVVSLADAPDGKLTLKLEPCGTITGRALNPEGDPIRGGRIRVDASVPPPLHGYQSDIATAQSESNGRFTVLVPADATLIVGVSSSPYGGQFKFLEKSMIKVASGQTRDLGDITLEAKEMMQ